MVLGKKKSAGREYIKAGFIWLYVMYTHVTYYTLWWLSRNIIFINTVCPILSFRWSWAFWFHQPSSCWSTKPRQRCPTSLSHRMPTRWPWRTVNTTSRMWLTTSKWSAFNFHRSISWFISIWFKLVKCHNVCVFSQVLWLSVEVHCIIVNQLAICRGMG